MLDINNVNKELEDLRKTNAELKESIQKLESNQNMPSVQTAESHKSHKEHKQKKDMFSCSDCYKKYSQINFLRTILKTHHTKKILDFLRFFWIFPDF